MTRDTRVQLVALVLMAASLFGSGVLATQLTAIAGREKLTFTDRAEDANNPWVAAGIAMGAFRGVFVNWLWMRANDLKEAGKFYEAMELSNAITKLQPRFPRVWVFHAWNMAYNISVSTQTPQERWQWVSNGIHLLRDEGIPANPNDMLLHKELAWIFIHKIGGYTDDANTYYKRRLAEEWHTVLGPPPPRDADDRDRAKATAKYVRWLRPIADAPATLEEVVAAEPSVADLVARLRARSAEPEPDRKLLYKVEIYRALRSSGRVAVYRNDPGFAKIKPFADLFDDPALQKAWNAYLPFVRRRVLQNDYHMEPERMLRYTEKYGPIDWRCHGAHSLYWSVKGVEAGLTRWTEANKRDFDFINTDRVTLQSVQELFRAGDLYFDFFASISNQHTVLQEAPNAVFCEVYGSIIKELRARSWADQLQGKGARAFSVYSAGYENFLRDAVCFFFRRGERAKAEYWYKVCREDPEQNLNNPGRVQELSVPIEEFVQHELETRYSTPSIAVQQVVGSLVGAYTSGLLGNDEELFRAQFKFAADAHRYFTQEQLRKTVVGAEYERMEQMDKDFRFVAGPTLVNFIESLSLEDAERVYDHAPEDLKAFAYEPLRERYKEQLDQEAKLPGGRSFDQVFPQPPSYASWRKWFEDELRARQVRTAPLENK